MKVKTAISSAEFPALFRRFLLINGWEMWQKRIAALSQQVEENPFYPFYVHDNHWIEMELARTHRHKKVTGRFPDPFDSWEAYSFQSFVGVTVQVYNGLTPAGKKRLAGMLRDTTPAALNSLQHEMVVVARFVGEGCDVELHDLEEGGGFDFLVKRDGIEIEVECKVITADIGRKVHRRKITLLGQRLRGPMSEWLEASQGGLVVRVDLSDRLDGHEHQQAAITRGVTAALRGEEAPEEDDLIITRQPFDIEEIQLSADETHESAMSKIRDHLLGDDIHMGNALVNYAPNRCALVIQIRSQKKDRVLDGIYRQLKTSSKKQFSKKRPSMMCARLLDISELEILNLSKARDTGLDVMTNQLMRNRPHLLHVAYTGPGEPQIKKDILGRSIQSKTSVYGFINPDHPMADDEQHRKIIGQY